MTKCTASFPNESDVLDFTFDSLLQDLDKHLGDLYPSIIGMFYK